VNKAQKILTLVFLAAFVATMIWAPWRAGGWRGYYWIFNEPFPNVAIGSELNWSQLATEWAALLILFIGLYAVLRTPRQ
jgi:hypothetical protein